MEKSCRFSKCSRWNPIKNAITIISRSTTVILPTVTFSGNSAVPKSRIRSWQPEIKCTWYLRATLPSRGKVSLLLTVLVRSLPYADGFKRSNCTNIVVKIMAYICKIYTAIPTLPLETRTLSCRVPFFLKSRSAIGIAWELSACPRKRSAALFPVFKPSIAWKHLPLIRQESKRSFTLRYHFFLRITIRISKLTASGTPNPDSYLLRRPYVTIPLYKPHELAFPSVFAKFWKRGHSVNNFVYLISLRSLRRPPDRDERGEAFVLARQVRDP